MRKLLEEDKRKGTRKLEVVHTVRGQSTCSSR